MLLSKSQKRILELIREFGGLKKELLFELAGKPPDYEKLIWELQSGGRVFLQGEYLCDEEKQPCERDIEIALEVMLEIGEEDIEFFQRGISPFAVTFFKQRQEKLYRYDICIVPTGKEIVVSAQLEAISSNYRIICLVVDDLSRRNMLNFPCEHIFVTKENGEYHYYK